MQRNKVSSAPAVTHICSGRKVNNDQIAIAIDTEKDDNVLDDEDDDKGKLISTIFFMLAPNLMLVFSEIITKFGFFVLPFYSSWLQITYYVSSGPKSYSTYIRQN